MADADNNQKARIPSGDFRRTHTGKTAHARERKTAHTQGGEDSAGRGKEPRGHDLMQSPPLVVRKVSPREGKFTGKVIEMGCFPRLKCPIPADGIGLSRAWAGLPAGMPGKAPACGSAGLRAVAAARVRSRANGRERRREGPSPPRVRRV